MNILPINGSPFMVLWYLYLAFVGVVIAFNIFCALSSSVLRWRVRTLMKVGPPKD